MSSEKAKLVRLSHVQFHKACVAMKKLRQDLQTKRPSHPEAAKMIEALTGFPISETTIVEMKKATGVQWTGKNNTRALGGTPESMRQNALSTVVRALAALYEQLGVEKSEGFARLVDHVRQNGFRPSPSLPPIPPDKEPGEDETEVK
jgi:hypothetical protein